MAQKQSTKLRSRRRAALIIIIAVVAALLLLYFLLPRNEEQPRVLAREIERGDIQQVLNVTARLEPIGTEEIMPAGVPIAAIYVENGSRVERNTPLLRYDLSGLQDNYDEAVRLREESEAMVADMEAQSAELSGMDMNLNVDTSALTGISSQYAEQLNSLSSQFSLLTGELSRLSSDYRESMLSMQETLEQLQADLAEQQERLERWLEENGEGLFPTQPTTPTLPGDPTLPSLPTLPSETNPSEPEETTTAPSIAETSTVPSTTETTSASGETTASSAVPQIRDLSETPVYQMYSNSERSADSGSRLLQVAAMSGSAGIPGGGDVEAVLAQLQAQYQSAGQLLTQTIQSEAEAKRLLDNTEETVRAGRPGFVYGLSVVPGDEAPVSSVPLLTIYDDSSLLARFRANSFDMTRLAEGQQVTFRYNDQVFHGQVEEVAPLASLPELSMGLSVDQTEASVPVTLSIDDSEGAGLVVGFDIDSEILLDERKNVLLIPLEGLRQDADEDYYVWLLDEQGRISKQAVVPGLEGSFDVEIVSGIKAGDRIVVSADTELTAGQMVVADLDSDDD